MKKYGILVSVLFLSVVTGCFFSKETVTCTMEGKQSGMDATKEIAATFEGNELKQLNMKITVDVKDQTDGMKGVAKSVLESTFKEMETDGITESVTEEEDHFDVVVDVDFEKTKTEGLEQVDQNLDSHFADMKEQKATADDFIKVMEEDGYSCKK